MMTKRSKFMFVTLFFFAMQFGCTLIQPASRCPGAPVIASFEANPVAITAGQSTTLSWGKVDNATSAVIDQGIGQVAVPGNTSVKPDKTTSYTLTATGCGGMVIKQVTITVNPGDVENLEFKAPLLQVLKWDLAVTQVSYQAGKVSVQIKNTGTLDFNGSVRVVCVGMGWVRFHVGDPPFQRPIGSDETTKLSVPKGGTTTFNPNISLDPGNTYQPLQCIAGVDGDPTPDDNTNAVVIP